MCDAPHTSNFERLYGQVLEEIIGGHFRPGDRISIKDFALKLKVSTTPLREIFSRLAGRGLVEERRSEGYYFPRLDAQDLSDLYELHSVCVLHAVSTLRSTTPIPHTSVDTWCLFDAVTRRTGNNALAHTRALIDDRLKVARRFEAKLVADQISEADRFSTFLANSEPTEISLFVIDFHDKRRAIANELALQLSRMNRGP